VSNGEKKKIILQAVELRKHFGAIKAVDGVDFALEELTLHSIIGPNGAGKTTFFNCLTGKFPITEGKIFFGEQEIHNIPTHKLVRLGVCRSFQILNIFKNLPVLENLRIAIQARHPNRFNPLGKIDAKSVEEAEDLLKRIGLNQFKDTMAQELSHGDQRLLEIGITIATNPKVLLLDEPAAGLSDSELYKLVNIINELRKSMSIVLIEHDIDMVLSISDTISVMSFGKIIAEGSPEEIQNNDKVRKAYLGD
jgi:ABC-type branched-subunit amino acid transport system ATPase component